MPRGSDEIRVGQFAVKMRSEYDHLQELNASHFQGFFLFFFFRTSHFQVTDISEHNKSEIYSDDL